VWLCGFVAVCCVALWLCGCVVVWLCYCVAVWLCYCVAVWLFYCVAAWQCAVWLCGCYSTIRLALHCCKTMSDWGSVLN